MIPWKNPANTILIGTSIGIDVPKPSRIKQNVKKTKAVMIVRYVVYFLSKNGATKMEEIANNTPQPKKTNPTCISV